MLCSPLEWRAKPKRLQGPTLHRLGDQRLVPMALVPREVIQTSWMLWIIEVQYLEWPAWTAGASCGPLGRNLHLWVWLDNEPKVDEIAKRQWRAATAVSEEDGL